MSVAEVDARLPDPSKQQLGESMARDFLNLRNYRYKDLNHWMEKQTYTAVGLTVMAAAELGVEATPLEGFDPASVDKAFKIRETRAHRRWSRGPRPRPLRCGGYGRRRRRRDAAPRQPHRPRQPPRRRSLFALDMPSSSALTRQRFGWEPTHPSLIDDLAAGDYPALG